MSLKVFTRYKYKCVCLHVHMHIFHLILIIAPSLCYLLLSLLIGPLKKVISGTSV